MIHWLQEKLGMGHHCPACETLVEYALEGLKGREKEGVRRHLEECPACREQVRDYLQVNEGLALNAPAVECPSGFSGRVLQRIQAECPHPHASAPAPAQLEGWPRFWMTMGPVFALLSLLMTLVALAALLLK